MKQVTIVADGSSLSNGQDEMRAGAAAVLEYCGVRKITGKYLGKCTNQQAEIIAACLGLEALKEPCRVTLISDSEYLIKTMQGLYKRKANLDLWQRLDRAARPHQITWTWTRGHAGHELQEKCDLAARLIAEQGRVDEQALSEILRG
jgi:ribonuclease HI